jgi:hypothetical protein
MSSQDTKAICLVHQHLGLAMTMCNIESALPFAIDVHCAYVYHSVLIALIVSTLVNLTSAPLTTQVTHVGMLVLTKTID